MFKLELIRVAMQFKAWMCVKILCVMFCVGTGHVIGQSPVKEFTISEVRFELQQTG